MELILGRQGNQPMPITDRSVGRRHAVLRILPDGTYEIEGIESHEILIDGMAYAKKRITADTPIQLGGLHTTVQQLLTAPMPPCRPAGNGTPAGGAQAAAQPPNVAAEFDRLEKVWKGYREETRKLQMSVTKLNNMRMAILPLGSLIGIGASLASTDNNAMRMVGSVIGVIFSVAISLIIGQLSMKRQRAAQEGTEELTAKFMLNYTCPNPKCRRFLGNTPFKVLKAQGTCPYCKAKFK